MKPIHVKEIVDALNKGMSEKQKEKLSYCLDKQRKKDVDWHKTYYAIVGYYDGKFVCIDDHTVYVFDTDGYHLGYYIAGERNSYVNYPPPAYLVNLVLFAREEKEKKPFTITYKGILIKVGGEDTPMATLALGDKIVISFLMTEKQAIEIVKHLYEEIEVTAINNEYSSFSTTK